MFLVGVALPSLLFWNPLGWSWATISRRNFTVEYQSGGQTAAANRAAAPPASARSSTGARPCFPASSPINPARTPWAWTSSRYTRTRGRRKPAFGWIPASCKLRVRTVNAETGSIPVDIRTVGLLDYNEKDLAFMNTKFEGWIEKVVCELCRRAGEQGSGVI